MALVSMLAAGTAEAQQQQVRRGPLPVWATRSEPMAVPGDVGGPVFIRRQDVETHLDARGQAQYLGYRFKILQSNALQLGNLSLAWDPTAGPPIIHGITVIRDRQMIDVLKTASFEVLRREDKLEEARLDGMLTAMLRVPDLRVGDELEIEWTSFSRDPVMGNKASGLLMMAPSPAPGRYHIGLSWEAGHTPHLKMTPDLAEAAKVGDTALDLRFDNPATLNPPKDAPPRYQWQRIAEYSDFADWETVSRHFAPLYDKASALAPASPLRAEAKRIAAAHASPLDRAAAALKLVQQDVRYIYVGLNGGNLTPATADETWQRRYGDCKGKTALLLALLRELGVDAEAVIVNSSGADDGFDQRLPGPQLFDHVLVRAHVDGRTYWLDGTLPAVATPAARPVFPVQWVLPLTAKGNGLEKLPWHMAGTPDEITLYDIDARAGFDKPAALTSTTIVRGVAGLQQQMQFSAVTPAQMLEAFRQNLTGDFWQTIDSVTWRYDQKAQASVLTIKGTGTVDWEKGDAGARSLALPGGGFSPPERRSRNGDARKDIPFYTKPEYECYATTLRLPGATEPRQWSATAGFDQRLFGRNYYRAWDLRDGAIRMVRASRVEQTEIDPASAERDNARIAAFDNSKGYVTYMPTGKKGALGQGAAIPTADAGDWTADNVPCMPPPKGA